MRQLVVWNFLHSFAWLERNMVMAPSGRPRFLRFLKVTLFLCLSHTPVFTVFLSMPFWDSSCWGTKSAVGAPNFFEILRFTTAKLSFFVKNDVRKLYPVSGFHLPASFFVFAGFKWLLPVTKCFVDFGHDPNLSKTSDASLESFCLEYHIHT